ncbi:MAG: translation initiation factor IF-3 [Acidobacteria bacterium]|nr:translation initiation factor IF-3 [Acidobacteriota bacterium]
MPIANLSVRVNERIRVREIRVIAEDGAQLGVMTPQEALKIAREQNLDLVEISPTAVPPVCKVMDYGKYVYELNKRAHEAKKKQRNIIIKEVKFRPNTDDHDYEFKKNNIVRFLNEGDKVKAIIAFRGREISHSEIGRRMMDRLIEDVAEAGSVETRPRLEGFSLSAIFTPKK